MSNQEFTGRVTYSMNGFRHNLNNSLAELKALVKQIADDQSIDEDHLDELMDSVNDLICQSNSVNCVYIPDDADFKNMSDLYLPPFNDEEEGEA